MEQLFFRLLNISINAGWLVLAVLMLRVLLKKAPRWLHVALWGLVGIRLALPFSIESIFSLIPSAETVPPTIVYEREPAIDSGFSSVDQIVNPIVADRFTPDFTTSANPLQAWGAILSCVWLIGLFLMVAYMLIGYLRLRFRLRTATKREGRVYESEFVSSPFILGIFRPRIYLPYGLNENTVDHVVAHEEAHLKRRDHLIKPLAFLFLAVYWFQPLLWVAYILLCRDIEYACDEKVIKNESDETRREYSMALLSCSIRRFSIAACPLAFGEVGVKARIKNVMNYKKPTFWLILLAVVAIIVASVCFLTNPLTDSKKAEVAPPMYYAAEKIVEKNNVHYFEAEHIPYFYIDENWHLYEKRKDYMTGSIIEEWKLCGTLEPIEGAREEAWTLSCTDEFGNVSQKTFTFYQNGRVEYFYGSEGGTCLCRMRAVPDMTKQLNVISIEGLHPGIHVSHFGTNISYQEEWQRYDKNMKLVLLQKNDTPYHLIHRGFEEYVDENGEHLVRFLDDVRLEKKTSDGWVTMDYASRAGWGNMSGDSSTVSFDFDGKALDGGIYRFTIFVDITSEFVDFTREDYSDKCVEKNAPYAEIIFEVVDPGEHISVE